MPTITTFLFAFLLLLSFSTTNAATTLYVSETEFLDDLDPSRTLTENFDNLVPFDFENPTSEGVISNGTTINGVTYTYSIPGVSMIVDELYDTTSGSNYLGTDDGSGAFLGGDGFTLSFDQTIHAIGMYVMSADDIFASDFTITTSMGQSVSNIGAPSLSLGDGNAYYLGLIENDLSLGFNSITLSSSLDLIGDYSFNVDDITVSAVPEPSTFMLFGLGLLGVMGMIRRKTRQNITIPSV